MIIKIFLFKEFHFRRVLFFVFKKYFIVQFKSNQSAAI